MSELLSSEAYRLSRLLSIPQRWRGDEALRLPADSHTPGSGIKPLPGFFEMWLRDQAAALMGRRAEENWRTLVRQEAESLCPEPEGLSQRRAASQQQPQAGEKDPSHFVLDGATCKKDFVFSEIRRLSWIAPLAPDPLAPAFRQFAGPPCVKKINNLEFE
jgi:hypothetical protein